MPVRSFGLLDFAGAVFATILVVSVLLVLPSPAVRAICLGGGFVGGVVGWTWARRRSWEYVLILIPAGALGGALAAGVGWAVWGRMGVG
mgnify:FL=1|jgi:presenilin-like A22 family membrane protease